MSPEGRHDAAGMVEIQEGLLPATTVRISISGRGRTGTGFFVAPDTVVTCRHVLAGLDLAAPEAATMIEIEGIDSAKHKVEAVRHVSPDEIEDVAVLRVAPPPDAACVLLIPGLNPADRVHGFGYTAVHGEGVPVTLVGEGLTGDRKLFRLREGQVEHGMSGSPVLSLRTGGVCGILKRTRDPGQALGGYAIPITTLVELSPPVVSANRAFHMPASRWVDGLPDDSRQVLSSARTQEAGTGPPATVVVITVDRRPHHWEVTAQAFPGETIGPVVVDLNTVRVAIARLLGDWASPDSTWRGRVDRADQVKLLGTILSTAVLPEGIEAMVRGVLSNRAAGWTEIALRFEEGAEQDLQYLPWEHLYLPMLHDQPETFFAKESGIAFTRARGREPEQRPAPPQRELSIALIGAEPPGATEHEQEIADAVAMVVDGMQKTLADKRVRLSVAESSDPSVLMEWLANAQADIVHYVGFGRFHGGADEIAFSRKTGALEYIGAATFANLLAEAPPRVVLLQLCDASSEMIPVRADLAPFAPEVFARGADALVAYQYPTRATESKVFNEEFYKRIVGGSSVEMAVQSGRRALHMKDIPGRAYLAPTVCVKTPGALVLTAGATAVTQQSLVTAGPTYG